MKALTGPWREAQDNTITLPEGDVGTWEKAAKILRGEKLFSDGSIEVLDPEGNQIEYSHGGDHQQIGDWTFPEATLTQFENLIDLLVLADQYLWKELREECLEKILQFPIGAEALAVLVAVPETVYKFPPGCDRSLPKGLQEFVQDALKYHSSRYDEWYGGNRHGTRHLHLYEKRSKVYESLDDFMKENMSAEAWAVYTALADNRAAKDSRTKSEMDSEQRQCDEDQERQGVLIKHWNMFAAVEHCLCWNELSTRPYGTSPEVEIQWFREKFSKLFPDEQPCSEANPGDIIIRIRFGMPGDDIPNWDYVSGFNTRTQQTEWYPRSWVRFLETSSAHCTGQWGNDARSELTGDPQLPWGSPPEGDGSVTEEKELWGWAPGSFSIMPEKRAGAAAQDAGPLDTSKAEK